MWGGEKRMLATEFPTVPSATGETIGPDDPLWGRLFYRGRVVEQEQGIDFDEAAVRTAEDRLSEAPSEPWLLYVPLVMPHCPFQAPEPWYSMHERSQQRLPVPLPDADAGAPTFVQAIHERYGLDRATPEVW